MTTNVVAGALADVETEALHGMLSGGSTHPREEIQAEIARREMASLAEGVAETVASLAERGRLDLGSARVHKVLFSVTTDYDDGPAWSTRALAFLSDGRQVGVDFDRTGVADSLVELSEHACPTPGEVLLVRPHDGIAEVRRG